MQWGTDLKVDIVWPNPLGWLFFLLRGSLVVLVLFGLLGPLLIARAIGADRLGQAIVQLACKMFLAIIQLPLRIKGSAMKTPGALVANHSAWLDIFTLNAAERIYFVAKSEVKNWPLIGLFARSVGTVFIERRQSKAMEHKGQLSEQISANNKLLFFPEGTSTDGRRLLPFRSTLFEAFFNSDVKDDMWVQAVSLNYVAPVGQRSDFYGWYGDMTFLTGFIMVLGKIRQGEVVLTFHEPQKISDHKDRKTLAVVLENQTRSGLDIS